jgi:succinoglycan biosynthesis transport protein ExoP
MRPQANLPSEEYSTAPEERGHAVASGAYATDQRREHDGFSVRTALRTLRRRLGVVLACTILVPAAALGFSLVREKQYTASASLFFRDPALDQTLFGSTFLEPAADPVREAATNVKLVSLEAVAGLAADEVGGGLTADDVSEKVEATAEGQSDVVSIRATDPSPGFAARLANTVAEQYIAFRREADRAKVREAQRLVERELDALSPAERAAPEGRSLAENAQQLEILGSLQTGNAELVQRAQPPESPSSPRPIRNTILGAVLGLMLGVALSFLFERLDRRVRDPTEIEQAFGRPILGTIPASRALARGGPTHGGALPAAEAEAFRMLRANLRYFNVDRPIESVLVTSSAPGDGKTTVSWNLAAAAAGAGALVLLIEADLRHPMLAQSSSDLRPEPGLSTVLAGYGELTDAVQRVAVHESMNNAAPERIMDVLTAGPLPPNPVDLIESQRMRELIAEAERAYDLVVIDTPPTSVVSDAVPLVKQVSGVIVVVRFGKSTREAVLALKSQLEHLQAPTLGVVLNAHATGASYGYGYSYGSHYAAAENGSPAPHAVTISPPDDRSSARGT